MSKSMTRWREHAFNAWGAVGICSMYGVILFWPHPPRAAQIITLAIAMSWYAVEKWRER